MLVDSSEVQSDQAADVCIVGSGPAGITIARELAGSGLSIAVLESEGRRRAPEIEAVGRGSTSGWTYDLDGTRLRYLGGTSNHWSGLCRPLDPPDFEERPWIPYSGWSFPRNELDPWYEQAQAVCELGPFDCAPASWLPQLPGAQLLLDNATIGTALWQLSAPTRFWARYGPELVAASEVTVFTHANVVNLESDGGGTAVDRVRVAAIDGGRFSMTARVFVLAVGAIETARLLLASRDVRPAGIGNQQDLVGRFFMEHPHLPLASALVLGGDAPSTALYYPGLTPRTPIAGWANPLVVGALAVAPEVLAEEGMRGWSVSLAPLARELASYRDSPVPAPAIAGLVRDVNGQQRPRTLGLLVRAEQAPNPESRVTLAERTDALGVPLVHVNWALTEADVTSIRRGLELFGERIGADGLGRVHIRGDDIGVIENPVVGGPHHMGTARMHEDPAQGVVDPTCRVHETDNLYVAGSAVFPTGGWSNPTLTIVALALRLAAHLRARM